MNTKSQFQPGDIIFYIAGNDEIARGTVRSVVFSDDNGPVYRMDTGATVPDANAYKRYGSATRALVKSHASPS